MSQPSEKAIALGAYFLQNPDGSQTAIVASQIDHRLELVQFWDIKPGSRVLELGCGQGDCTVVLADAVGESGHVDAVDPGAPDYGSPATLSQAQDHIKTTPLGSRITFHLSTDPITFLSSRPADSKPYDYIVLAHCIWYFATPQTLTAVTSACISHTRKLCIAEWSLRSSTPASHPHVLVALLLASLQAKRDAPSSANIRTILSPAQIIANIHSASVSIPDSKPRIAGFKLEEQATKPTNLGMLDGYWETSYALRTRENVLERLGELGVKEGEVAAMGAGFDAVEAAVGLLDVTAGEERVKGVKSMDFWVGVFAAV